MLILYGTNDWNLSACHRVITCFTIENARSMIRQAKAAGTIPVLATVIPVNPAYVSRLADERNFWVDETNKELVTMARAEGAIVADLNAAMKAESSDLRELFTDHVHPNDRGYGVMADAFFRALTQPVGALAAGGRGSAGGGGVFFFVSPAPARGRPPQALRRARAGSARGATPRPPKRARWSVCTWQSMSSMPQRAQLARRGSTKAIFEASGARANIDSPKNAAPSDTP